MLLQLNDSDVYGAHTALRHAHDISDSEHKIYLTMPVSLRNHRGFTPWLAYARPIHRDTKVRNLVPVEVQQQVNALHIQNYTNLDKKEHCVLQLRVKGDVIGTHPSHVEAQATNLHYASFDFRIAGKIQRTLVDSGATCSCMSEQYAKDLHLKVVPGDYDEDISGIGGVVDVCGKVTTTVKLAKRQVDHEFYVIKEPIAGYQCLIGQDFLARHSCGLHFSPSTVSFTVGGNASMAGKLLYTRKFSVDPGPSHSSIQVQSSGVPSQISSINSDTTNSEMARSDTTSTKVDPPVQGKERKALLRSVNKGKCIAYEVVITPQRTIAATEVSSPIPDTIQAVIDKHSTDMGTLRGSIPPNTHVKGYDCHIELIPGAQPVQIRQYRLTPREREELEGKVKEFIKLGWIEPSVSPWCSSVLFVPKPGGKLRFCVDYRRVNQVTVPDRHPIPQQEEIVDRLQGSARFSSLDLASGFYQLAITERSRGITAFPTPFGLYQWRVMPMGLCNAPAVFQRAMNQILSEHITQGYCLVYIDDIVIFSKSLEDHAKHLDAVLQSLRKHNLFCQLPKCVWAQRSIKYLGQIVDGTGVLPDPSKVKILDHWEPPSTAQPEMSSSEAAAVQQRKIHECRRFLGFMNYFARFIPRYAQLAAPLYEQTKVKGPPWSTQCTESWNRLKNALRSATLMHHPVFEKPFHVYKDASVGAIGGALMQEQEGHMSPIAFVARKMTSAEMNYITTEQELLALVYCFQKWRCYLDGSETVVHSDHEPLTWLQTQKTPSRRQARWLEYLSRFQYQIIYVRGDENVVADALSRMLSVPEEAEEALPADHWPLYNQGRSIQVIRSVGTASHSESDKSLSFRASQSDTGESSGSPVSRTTAATGTTPTTSGGVGAAERGTRDVGRSTSALPQRRVTFRATESAHVRTADSVPRVWGPSTRPWKRARVASLGHGGIPSGLDALHGRRSVGAHGAGAVGTAVSNAEPIISTSAVRPTNQLASDSAGATLLQAPRSADAGGTAGCYENPPVVLSLLTLARFAAAGGHTRARARRAGPPVWGEEGRPCTARKDTGGLWFAAGVQPLPTDLPEPPMSETLDSDVSVRSELGSLANDNMLDRGLDPEDRLEYSERVECGGSAGPDPIARNLSNSQGEFDSGHRMGRRTSHPIETQGSGSEGAKPSGEPDPSLTSYEQLLIQLFSRIQKGLQTDQVIQDRVRREELGLTQRGQLWWKGNLLYIPPDEQLRQDVLYWHHDVPWCAHMGIHKTLEMVKRQFWWPNLNSDVTKYIQSCYKCQGNKVDRQLRRPPLTPSLAPGECWRTVGIDLIVDLPTSANGHNAVCTIRDHLSKMYRILPVNSAISAAGIAKLYFKEVFPHYGMPVKIISDRDRRWNNEFWDALCKRSGIQMSLSTAYHPQTNGLVERGNEVISAALRHYVSADQKDWDEFTPFIEFAVNDMHNESTQCSAFSMNRITLPRNPFNAILEHVVEGEPYESQCTTSLGGSQAGAGARTHIQAHAMFQWARKCLEISKQRMKDRYDAKGVSLRTYKIGDLVWFSVRNIGLRHPSRRHKLSPRYIGPLKIIEIVGRSAVKLDLPQSVGIHPTVSISQVKPFIPRIGTPPPPVSIGGELEWEVEAITDHNLIKPKGKKPSLVEFKIKWKGNYEDSWHEFRDLEGCISSLEHYLLHRCTPVKRRAILETLKPSELKQLGEQVKNLVT